MKKELKLLIGFVIVDLIAIMASLAEGNKIMGYILAFAALIMFVLIAMNGIFGLIGIFKKKDESTDPTEPIQDLTDNKAVIKKDCLWIALFTVVMRVSMYLVGYAFALAAGKVSGGFFETLPQIWCRGGIDAPHYMGIAENFYVTTGDPMYHIVFFPFFPIVVRLLSYLTLGNYFVAATLLNLACSVGIAVLGYKLAAREYSIDTARRFVLYIFILPGAFFYGTPMTEALFVLLTLAFFWFLGEKKFLLCGIIGAFASFTRSAGVFLAVPMFIEIIKLIVDENRNGKPIMGKLIGYGACNALVFVGLLGYLLINKIVWNNPLQFTIFQREHWHQSIGLFTNTVQTIVEYAGHYLKEGQLSTFMSLSVFQLTYIIGSLACVFAASKKLKPQYIWYFICYFAFSIGATWLLSAPRYLMASVVLPLAMAIISEKKSVHYALASFCIVSSVIYTALFILGASVY